MRMESQPSTIEGLCKLTRRPGKFVKSHIIPESLTRPSIKGNALYQYRGGSPGERPVRRWTSWYDSELVTDAGEKHLANLDDWAVRELRKHRLVWGGWGDERTLPADHTVMGPGSIGIRRVDEIDTSRLRLFFLSLLWRAAATTLKEFSEIVLSVDELEKLRSMVVSGNITPLSFYACQLTQLSTKGVMHNHAPVADMKYLPDLTVIRARSLPLPTYRFYFDGLIAHMHVSLPKSSRADQLGNLIVGAENSLILSTVSFEDSLQYMNMRAVFDEHGIDMGAQEC